MEDVHHNQNQDRSVESAVCPLEQEDVADAKDETGDGNGAQRQKIDRLGQLSALADRKITQQISKGCACQSGQERQLQGVQDIGSQADAMGVAENVRDMLQREGEVIRKRLCEGQADKCQLRGKKQDTKKDNQRRGDPVEKLLGFNQLVLFVAVLQRLPRKPTPWSRLRTLLSTTTLPSAAPNTTSTQPSSSARKRLPSIFLTSAAQACGLMPTRAWRRPLSILQRAFRLSWAWSWLSRYPLRH